MTDRREPLVLVLGIQEEWAAVEVGKELDARGVRWVPLNVADFPVMMTLGAELTSDADGWHGSVRGAEHELPLEEVTAVYYGRPTEFVMPPGCRGRSCGSAVLKRGWGSAVCWPASRSGGSRTRRRWLMPRTSRGSLPC